MDLNFLLNPPWIFIEIFGAIIIIGENRFWAWVEGYVPKQIPILHRVTAEEDKPAYHNIPGVGLSKVVEKQLICKEVVNGRVRSKHRYVYQKDGKRFTETWWNDQVIPESIKADMGFPEQYFTIQLEEDRGDKLERKLTEMKEERNFWKDHAKDLEDTVDFVILRRAKVMGKVRDEIGPKFIQTKKKGEVETGGEGIEAG